MAGNVDATASLSEADVVAIRADFPILGREVGGHPLTYLDSANTSQKPQVVIDAIAEHYGQHNANVARAMHRLGLEATQAFEGGRERIAQFLGASRPEEVVALSNASEALNLAANTLGTRLGPRDEVVITIMEHHSNLVPWQLVCERTGAKLRWFDITDDGQLDLDKAEREGLINEHTKVVSLALASNVLGTINPVQRIAQWAHQVGAVVVVDASQAVPQMPVNVTELGADLLAFTGHKMLGPTGIGILWGRYDLLDDLPPFLGGGEMIEVVRMTGSTYAADRPAHGPRGRCRLPGRGRNGCHRPARTSAGCTHARGAGVGARGAHPRPHGCHGSYRHRLVHRRRCAPARRHEHHGRSRCRRARWSPLCPAVARATGNTVVAACVVIPVHHGG